VLTSTNGQNWKFDQPNSTGLSAIAFGHDTFLGAGPVCPLCVQGELASSANGVDWYVHVSSASTGFFGVTYGRGTFVAVGGYGTILQSDPYPPRLELVPNFCRDCFAFNLLGDAGESYRIEASRDLTNWTAITNLVSATGTNQFIDPAAPNSSRRFYRAVSP